METANGVETSGPGVDYVTSLGYTAVCVDSGSETFSRRIVGCVNVTYGLWAGTRTF